jgi:hypothetical protein
MNQSVSPSAPFALTSNELGAVIGGMTTQTTPPKPIEIVIGPVVISIGPGGVTVHPSH